MSGHSSCRPQALPTTTTTTTTTVRLLLLLLLVLLLRLLLLLLSSVSLVCVCVCTWPSGLSDEDVAAGAAAGRRGSCWPHRRCPHGACAGVARRRPPRAQQHITVVNSNISFTNIGFSSSSLPHAVVMAVARMAAQHAALPLHAGARARVSAASQRRVAGRVPEVRPGSGRRPRPRQQ
jgi:hypothetical protein